MASCIKRKHLEKGITKLAKQVPINKDGEKFTRVNIWEISDLEVEQMVRNFSADGLVESGKIPSKKVSTSTANSLKRASEHKSFVYKIMNTLFSNGFSGRHQAMGLKQILDTIEGELNKAVNYEVDLADIQNSDGIPYILVSD